MTTKDGNLYTSLPFSIHVQIFLPVITPTTPQLGKDKTAQQAKRSEADLSPHQSVSQPASQPEFQGLTRLRPSKRGGGRKT